MVSTSLTLLRNTPPAQANIYQGALLPLVKLRQATTPGSIDQKVAQQAQISQTGLSALQSLLDQSNAAERAIRAAPINVDDTQPSSTAMDNVRWLLDKRIDIADMCAQFVRQRDRESFKALRFLLPWANTAKLLQSVGEGGAEDRLVATMTLVRAAEAPLMTTAERALLAEIKECDISLPYIRDNFQKLSDWLTAQGRPASLDGYSGGRIMKLYNWQGLPGSTVPPFILTPDDHNGKYSSLEANMYRTGIDAVDNLAASKQDPGSVQWVGDNFVRQAGYTGQQ